MGLQQVRLFLFVRLRSIISLSASPRINEAAAVVESTEWNAGLDCFHDPQRSVREFAEKHRLLMLHHGLMTPRRTFSGVHCDAHASSDSLFFLNERDTAGDGPHCMKLFINDVLFCVPAISQN